MPNLCVRSKYSLNGECHFENVPQQIAQNVRPRIELGTVGGVKCYAKLRLRTDGNVDFVIPCFWIGDEESENQYVIRGFFTPINKNDWIKNRYKSAGRKFLHSSQEFRGTPMPILEVLNQKNGWLNENGRLSIEYGVHVDSILEDDEKWRFNFYDKLIDRDNMLRFVAHRSDDYKRYYCNKHLLSLHSTYFKSQNQSIFSPNALYLFSFLQISHGVRADHYFEKKMAIIKLAEKYQMWNVKHFCEHQLIEDDSSSSKMSKKEKLKEAIALNLTRYLIESIRSAGSTNQILKVLKTSNMKKMSSETMKMLIASCLYDQFLNY